MVFWMKKGVKYNMSTAYECDRCKKLFTNRGSKDNTYSNAVSVIIGGCMYDLCPECQKSFDDWWNMKTNKVADDKPKYDGIVTCNTCKYDYYEHYEEPCKTCLKDQARHGTYSKFEPRKED